MLEDDHPWWEQHSGGDGHRGPEWEPEDREAAETFYASISGKSSVFIDLLIDHPGQQLDVERICDLRPDAFDGPHSIAGALRGLHQAQLVSARRYPFYWWHGNPTRYGMKPRVAALFRQARAGAHGGGP